jgi:two-component system nitrate/nitrite response regulator NarL
MVAVPKNSTSVILIGPCQIFREGLRKILRSAGFSIVSAGPSLADTLSEQAPSLQGQVLLLIDVCKDFSSIIKEIENFNSCYPTHRIALLAGQEQLGQDQIMEAFRVGAHAYLTGQNTETLVKSLELLLLGEMMLAPQMIAVMFHRLNEPVIANDPGLARDQAAELDDAFLPDLSANEISILRCFVSGDSNRTMARKYSVSERTIKVQVKAIYRKIRVRNRTQAAIWALSHRLAPGRAENVLMRSAIGDVVISPGSGGAIGTALA